MTALVPHKLPVKEIARDALKDVFGDIKGFLRVSGVMILLIMGLGIANTALFGEDWAQLTKAMATKPAASAAMNPDINPAMNGAATAEKNAAVFRILPGVLLLVLGQWLLLFLFNVAWYQQLLLGKNKGKTIFLRFGKAEWNMGVVDFQRDAIMLLTYIGCAFLTGVAMALSGLLTKSSLIIGVLAGAVFCVTLFFWLRFTLRLSLVDPLAIVGQRDNAFTISRRMMKGREWSFLVGFLLVTFPTWLVFLVLFIGIGFIGAALTGASQHALNAVALVVALLSSCQMVVLTALPAAYTARVYAWLRREEEAGVALPATPVQVQPAGTYTKGPHF